MTVVRLALARPLRAEERLGLLVEEAERRLEAWSTGPGGDGSPRGLVDEPWMAIAHQALVENAGALAEALEQDAMEGRRG